MYLLRKCTSCEERDKCYQDHWPAFLEPDCEPDVPIQVIDS